ncbi:MAG: ABC transporter substrate-binding protein [Pseudomonadota bacterium]
MHQTRRGIFASGLTLALGVGLSVSVPAGLLSRPAYALEADDARAHVERAVDAVLNLVRVPGDAASKADKLRQVLDQYAAMPQIARFAAGLAWRDMSDAQQAKYTDAFEHFLSTVYARRFSDYAGQDVIVGGVSDSGRRGLTVSSTVTQTGGQPILVDWLVTDRPGRIVIADIVIEGVSLLITQREEIAGMLSARGGDVDRLIADLAAA